MADEPQLDATDLFAGFDSLTPQPDTARLAVERVRRALLAPATDEAAPTDTLAPNPTGTGDQFPRTQTFQPTQPPQESSEAVGTLIAGKYELLEAIGEGGMGTVWLAQQHAPVRRQVAVKLIRTGLDSRAVLARFEAERQALAIMDHPHIAKILDGGVTAAGSPFFVMELVQGMPITRFCDERKLTPHQRLALFVPVCQAIQHAHQKGVIHRDIKPSNVLVTLYDDRPVPKVIDFGIAKAIQRATTVERNSFRLDPKEPMEPGCETAERNEFRSTTNGHAPQFTDFGNVVGTPEYMSPEQASFDHLDIDTRSDVYSLGVLLYELLAGSPPFRTPESKKSGPLEMLRRVREEQPSKPSDKLSTADTLPIAANRGTPPKQLAALLRSDLDWIAMKAIEKDRARRYETPTGLAADIQRFLAGEVVTAHPPSRSYRLQKFLRKHRGPVLAGSLVAIALIGGMLGTTIGLFRAESQRNRAQVAESNTIDQRNRALLAASAERLAKEAAQLAERAARESQADTKAFSDFLVTDVLSVARPEGQKGGLGIEVTVRQALEAAQSKIAATFHDQPRAEAVARHDLGVTFRLIGELQQAEPHLRRAVELRKQTLGIDHEDTLNSQNSLAVLLGELGMNAEAITIHEETLRLRKAILAAHDPSILNSMCNLASCYMAVGKLATAVQLYEQTLRIQKTNQGVDHPDTLTTINNLALAYDTVGNPEFALPLWEDSLAVVKATLGTEHPDTLTGMNNLANAYRAAGKADLALSLHNDALRIQRTKLGADHPSTFFSMNGVAECYRVLGQLDRAIPLYEQTLKLRKEKLGPQHPDTLYSMNNLARGYYELGRPDLAVPLFEETLALSKAILGPKHQQTLVCANGLAVAYVGIGKLHMAVPLIESTLDVMRVSLAPDHEDILACISNLATCYVSLQKPVQALPLFEETLRITSAKLGSDHPQTLTTMSNLAVCYRAVGKLDQALPLYIESLKLVRAKLGSEHPETLRCMSNLATAYQAMGNRALALELFEEALPTAKRQFGPAHPNTLLITSNLAAAYMEANQLDLALPLFQHAALTTEEQRFAHEHAGKIVINLIACHEKLKQFDEAETWRRKWLPIAKLRSGAQSGEYVAELSGLGLNLLEQKKYADAEPILREALVIHQSRFATAWQRFNVQSMLGGALAGMRQYAEAEPLLLAGYGGLKEHVATAPDAATPGSIPRIRVNETLQRLVQLYEAWGKPGEAAKWQKALDSAKRSDDGQQ